MNRTLYTHGRLLFCKYFQSTYIWLVDLNLISVACIYEMMNRYRLNFNSFMFEPGNFMKKKMHPALGQLL